MTSRHPSVSTLLSFVLQCVILLPIVGCDSTSLCPPTLPVVSADASLSSHAIQMLSHMPPNSDDRCLGICVVLEAMLDGEPGGDSRNCDDFARQIYHDALRGCQVQYPRDVIINGQLWAVESPESLERLSTAITDAYKHDCAVLLMSQLGNERLWKASTSFVMSIRELDHILDQDPDHVDAFCCVGIRRFPDGTLKESHHVVLIQKGPDGIKRVYDPNDPGRPFVCHLEDEDTRVSIEWTCKSPRTGSDTRQVYNIVHKDVFLSKLRLALENSE